MGMKKKLLTVCLVFSFVFSVCAQKVEVNSKGFFLNRHKITRETRMAVIDSLLGKPDRVFSLANTIWTYDSLGLFIYFAVNDSSLRQVSFDLVKRGLRFSPVTPFTGRFVIYNNLITSAWSLSRLKRIKALEFGTDTVYLNPAYASYVKMYFEFDEAKKVLRHAGVALQFKKPD
jgi:hypothetical protein